MVKAEDFAGAAALKKNWEERLQALQTLSASSQTEDSVPTHAVAAKEAEEAHQEKLRLLVAAEDFEGAAVLKRQWQEKRLGSSHEQEAVQALVDRHEFKAGAAMRRTIR